MELTSSLIGAASRVTCFSQHVCRATRCDLYSTLAAMGTHGRCALPFKAESEEEARHLIGLLATEAAPLGVRAFPLSRFLLRRVRARHVRMACAPAPSRGLEPGGKACAA